MRRMMLAAVVMAVPVVAMAAEPQSFPGWVNDTFALPPAPANQTQAICIQGALCVGDDGNVTLQPGVAMTDAAKRFWNAVAQVRGHTLPFPEEAAQ